MVYKFTRNFDAAHLKRVILEHEFPELSVFTVKINSDGSISEDNVVIGFTSALSPAQEITLIDIMAAPTLDPLTVETDATVLRHADGFALYQRIFADISIAGNLSSVDGSIAMYPTLQNIRCMLKDGMGETALRYLIKHIQPLGAFTPEQIENWRLWVREFCQKYRPSQYDEATYDGILTMIETEVSI
jgi:hypothetical protein